MLIFFPFLYIKKHQPLWQIAIEGNIASGKSTLLDYLQNVNKAQVVEEPVFRWQHVVDGESGNLIVGFINESIREPFIV